MEREIDLYREPLEILNRMENRNYAAMSDFELAFICGVIKRFRPSKIVEVGVAAGGTTVVILNCLKLLKYSCEMYSVDICTQYYKDTARKTGFVAEKFLEEETMNSIKHQFILGRTAPAALDIIGDGIEFVVLDTMHSLPGELLDFISIYHSLDKNAVIVFHDVGQSQLGIGNVNGAPSEYASLVTLTVLAGEKYLALDSGRVANLSNIGAVKLNEDMDKCIENLFLALFINWNYIPDQKSLNEYRQIIEKEYNERYYQMFEQAIECNVFSLYRQRKLKISLRTMKCEFEKVLKEAEIIYIYGAGQISAKLKKYIDNFWVGGGQKEVYCWVYSFG